MNFKDEELAFPMGDGKGGNYAQLMKKVTLALLSSVHAMLSEFLLTNV